MAFFCNPAGSHMNMLNATSSCSHLEALTVPGACSLGLILTLILFPALCFSPLYLSPHIFWPHLLLVPAGSLGIWKWNSSMARLVPVRHRHNSCSETQQIIRLTLRKLVPSSATRKAQKCLVNSLQLFCFIKYWLLVSTAENSMQRESKLFAQMLRATQLIS